MRTSRKPSSSGRVLKSFLSVSPMLHVSVARRALRAREDPTVKRASFLAVGIATALVLAGCGDDDDTEPSAGDGASTPEPADIRVWLTPDTIPVIGDYLKTTFEEQNSGSTLTIEEQPWEGLVDRVTTATTSESDTPDVVELGNTQASSFTFAGAFTDLSDMEADLGGDDLLPGLVTSGTADDKL